MSIRRIVPNPRTLRGKLGIAAFLTTFIVLASSTASFAYWQSSQTVASTLSAANLTIATANLTSATFGNDVLVSTGSITATNTTTTSSTASASVVLTVTGAGALAGKVTRQIWTTTSAANCTPAATVPPGTGSGLWSASATLTSSLAAQASAIYCVRSTIASRESVAVAGGSGAQSFIPSVSGTITLGNFSGAATAAASQATQYIYPAATPDTTNWQWIRPHFANSSFNYCADVSGGGQSGSGTSVISYGCKTGGAINQNWIFSPSGVTGYYTIAPHNAPGLRMDNNGSLTSGGAVTVNSAAGNAATATNQQWQLQTVTTGVYEFVNAYSGMCLTSMQGTGQNLGGMTQTPCAGNVYQQFELSQTFQNFTCKLVNKTGSTNDAFTWSWTAATTGPYDVFVTGNGTTTKIASTAGTAAGVSIAYDTYAALGRGTYSMTFVDSNGTVVGLGSATVGSSITNSSCVATDPSL